MKIGDRVRFTKKTDNVIPMGSRGTILKIDEDGDFRIMFDTPIKAPYHKSRSDGKSEWWCLKSEIELDKLEMIEEILK
jgi:hypothetical protein